MAAIWTGGRESMLVADKVDRTTKDAISAVLSQVNDCPYCEDMLISLVHAGGEHEAAEDIFGQSNLKLSDETLRQRLEWVRAISTGSNTAIPETPFTPEQMPEIIGTLMGMSDINRFSHVVMEDSPVTAPFGLRRVKAWALRMFGKELEITRRVPLVPGRALCLLPPAQLPADMQWARANPRVADAVSRWTAAVEREAAKVVSPQARKAVTDSLRDWKGENMPLSREWIDEAVEGLNDDDAATARLAVVLAKAPYRITEKMVADVLGQHGDEARFIRILSWSSFTAARRFAQLVARRVETDGSRESGAIAA